GPFILGAMIWFLLMLRGIGRPAQASPRPSPPASFDIADSKGVAEGKLTVTTRKTNRQVTFPVWFVVQGKTVHLLPVHGSATDWYRNLKKNGNVTISIAGNVYGGAARAAQGKEAVKPVMDLFRDKYGDRNCTNFFGDRADVVVSIPTG
ncbi:MAG TPA: nitroreductase/quinone reductase family protein, partial [Nitrososphaerales archaeon]|nr:nitroreductase/quinone reductase family protein [Nitrososphaerales archaeon]